MQIVVDRERIRSLLTRRVQNIFPDMESVLSQFTSGKRLRFYLGIDPTSPHIHTGHLIPILFLKSLAQLGHEAILLIGDFTARIGDPTDKSSARISLSKEDIDINMATYLDQLDRVFPKELYSIRYNSQWLAEMSFVDVIRLSSHFSVQQMLTRDMFQKRLAEEKPIYMHEFFYPLMQGYDSVALEVDGEVGGNDQTFNMLVGRDLEKELLKKDKMVLAVRLLINEETGKKMSKTEGGIIALSDTPEDIYGKVMKMIPDSMIISMFELCTEVSDDIVEMNRKKLSEGYNPKHIKEELAFELVRMLHGLESANFARDQFNSIVHGDIPQNIREFKIVDSNMLIDVLMDARLCSSRAEAKRLIQNNAVSINGEKTKKWDILLANGDIVKIGSHQFIKITLLS